MNSTQIQQTAAPIIAFLAGLFASRNFFGWDAGTWSTVIGGIITFGTTIWMAIKGTKTNQIASVAALPEVQAVKLEPTAPASLVNDTPNNVNK